MIPYILIAVDKNNDVVSTSKIVHVITKGSKKGTVKINCYAANGVYKQIKVKVK